MDYETLVEQITQAVMAELGQKPAGTVALPIAATPAVEPPPPLHEASLCAPLLETAGDPDALRRMLDSTTARIGQGRAGHRLRTQTLLKLRADHAAARDAVFKDVDTALLERLGLFQVQSRCQNRSQHLTRPDLGRLLDEEALATLKQRCAPAPDVQIFASDGLSSLAIESNLPRLLPVLTDGLAAQGLKVGTPFFVKYGRVAIMEQVAEAIGCGKVVCLLIGERPGLGSAESMSAYLAYAPRAGMPESERTVVSNIYQRGIAAAEAGAYIVDVIGLMLAQKTGGVALKK